MKKIALLDADIICYTAGHMSVQWIDFDGDEVAIPNMDAAREVVDEIVQAWTKHAGADEPMCILSPDDRTNFRLLEWPQYKTHRKSSRKPPHLGEIQEYLRDRWNAYSVPYLEGDDVMGILATKRPEERIIVSTDKDMATVPGWHYNPNKDADGPRYVDAMSAQRFLQWQVLTGDPTDGYKGAKGIGPKKADIILKPHYQLTKSASGFQLQGDPEAAWSDILDVYRTTGQTVEDAVQNLAMARILTTDLYRKSPAGRFVQMPTAVWGENRELHLPCTS